jgi:hypothetical protein
MRELTVAKNRWYMQQLARARQQWEAWFALKVYDVFNAGLPRIKLQEIAKRLLGVMWRNYNQVALDASVPDVQRIWQRYTAPHSEEAIRSLIAQCPSMDATDCADVMRLAGTWVEKHGLDTKFTGHQGPTQPLTDNDHLKGDDLRKVFRGGQPSGVEQGSANDPVWGPGARQRPARGVDTGRAIEPHLQPYRPVMPNLAVNTGMTQRRALEGSVVSAMDRLFNLTVGCDISGTTADCTFDIELVNNLMLDPDEKLSVSAARMLHVAYYLIPTGTIVANMHHTLLETALTLSFDEVLDYRVGFFDTLTPRRLENWPQELAGIPDAMAIADGRGMRDNKLHYFCYYANDGRLSGMFQLEDFREITQWKLSHHSRATSLHQWARTHSRPRRADVKRLLLFAGL